VRCRVIYRRVSLAFAVFGTVACSRHPEPQTPEPLVTFATLGPHGLEQAVRLTSETVGSGDTIHIWSVIRNTGRDTLSIMASDDLATSGTLVLQVPRDLLRLNSIRVHALAPGDSVVEQEPRIVASPPGRYLLRVHHVTEPALVGTAEIRVRSASPR
jgi:hypothetical protein